jgi:hypothetical protein
VATTPIVFGGFPDYLEPVYTGVTMTGSADSGYPLTNLRRRELYKKARLSETETWTISWTYGGELRDISAVVLADHNFPADSTIQLLLYPTNVFTVGTTLPAYETGELPALYPFDTEFPTGETPEWGAFEWGGVSPEDRVLALPRNYIHLIMQDSGPTKGNIQIPRHITCGGGALVIRGLSTAANAYAQAGMLMTTKLWQPTRNFRWNWKVRMEPLGEAPQQSRTGRLWGRNYGAIRHMDLTLDLLERGEILDFPWTFSYDRGWSAPLLVVPEPDVPGYWWAMAGLFSLKPNQLLGMEARPTLQKLWDIGQINLVDWR